MTIRDVIDNQYEVCVSLFGSKFVSIVIDEKSKLLNKKINFTRPGWYHVDDSEIYQLGIDSTDSRILILQKKL